MWGIFVQTNTFLTVSKKLVWIFVAAVVAAAAVLFVYMNAGPSNQPKPISITTDSVVFKRGCVSADSSCLYVSFRFPLIEGEDSRQLSIVLYADYLQAIGDSSRIDGSGTIRDYLNTVVSQYDSLFTEFVSAFPQGAVNTWYLKTRFETLLNDGVITSIEYYTENYMGGAHPNYSYHYFNYSLQRNAVLSLSDVVLDMNLFLEKAEDSFRKNMNIPQGKSLEGYWFPNSKYALPNEVGFSTVGVVLHYNVYEIAPYSDGDIEYTIPYSEIGTLLKPEYSYLVKP